MAAANFDSLVLPFTLRYEGGRVDDPRDPGGRTDQGVTQRSFEAWLARNGRPARDVYTITPPELRALYRAGYWDAVKGDALPDGVDLALFDFAVNSGPARALKAYGQRRSNDAATVVADLCAARLSFLQALGTFRRFGRGWSARVAACEALGLKMAEHARIGAAPLAPTNAGTAAKLAARGKGAAAAAGRHRRRAAGALAVGAGALAAQPVVPDMAQLSWPGLAVVAALVGGLAGLSAWRARQQRARAAALAATAAEAVRPPAAAPSPTTPASEAARP